MALPKGSYLSTKGLLKIVFPIFSESIKINQNLIHLIK